MTHLPRSSRRRRGRLIGLSLWLLLAAGIAVVGYTKLDARLQQHKQDKLLADWSAEIEHWTPAPKPVAVEGKPASPAEPLPEWQEVDGHEMLGSVNIPSIDLKEPIFRGADAKTLLLGAGAVAVDRLPGQAGTNFVVASHRSWTFGRHFNRLDELEAGDEVEIETSVGTYRYAVTAKTLVLPDDLSVLANEENKSTLTLITCYPKRNPTHRLIVTAELQEKKFD